MRNHTLFYFAITIFLIAGFKYKLYSQNYILSTIGGGTGNFQKYGYNGPEINSYLYEPYYIAVDDSGNVFIGDNFVITKINSFGLNVVQVGVPNVETTVIQSGSALTTPISGGPFALNSKGQLFFSYRNGSEGYIFQKSSNGLISKWAGSGKFGYNGGPTKINLSSLPQAIGQMVFDSKGNLFLSDELDHRIWKISKDSIVSVIIGNGKSGYSGDGGLAVNATLNAYPQAGGNGGPTIGLATDKWGNLYFGDAGNNRIRKIDTLGIVTTIAGTGILGSSPDGVLADTARINSPTFIAMDSASNIYFYESGTSKLRRISSDGILSTIIGNVYGPVKDNVLGINTYAGIATYLSCYPNGDLCYLDSSYVMRWDHITGLVHIVAGKGARYYNGDGGLAVNAGLSVLGSVMDRKGNYFFYSSDCGCIRKIDTKGIITTLAGGGHIRYSANNVPVQNVALAYIQDLAIDTIGNIYFPDPFYGRVGMISTSGYAFSVAGTTTTGFSGDGGLATNAELDTPAGLVLDDSLNLYFCDYGNNRVRKVDRKGIISTILGGNLGYGGDGGPAIAATYYQPIEIAIDRKHQLYLADYFNYRIRKIDTLGNVTTIAGTGNCGYSGDGGPATNAEIGYVNALYVNDSGYVFFTDSNNVVRSISPKGIIRTIAGNGKRGFAGDGDTATLGMFNQVCGVCSDPYGNLYIADKGNYLIRRLSPVGQKQFTGIRPIQLSNVRDKWIVSPNPSSGNYNLKTDSIQNYGYELFDMDGLLVLNGKGKGTTFGLDLTSKSSGVYWLRIFDDSFISNRDYSLLKIVKN